MLIQLVSNVEKYCTKISLQLKKDTEVSISIGIAQVSENKK